MKKTKKNCLRWSPSRKLLYNNSICQYSKKRPHQNEPVWANLVNRLNYLDLRLNVRRSNRPLPQNT